MSMDPEMSSTAAKQHLDSISSFTGIVDQCNIQSARHSVGHYIVDFPGGFSYDAFNGATQVKPWILVRLMEAARLKIFTPDENGHSIVDSAILCRDNYRPFVLASSMQVRKRFYDIRLPKYPIRMDVKLSGIGKTSVDLHTEGYVNNLPEPLFFSQVKIVFICSQTNTPKPPPPWWFEKFTKEVFLDAPQLERFGVDGRDENHSSESKYTVNVADVDGYLHSNAAHYVRYCFSAFTDRCISQAATSRDRAQLFRQLSDLSILYKKETKIGDVLTTKVSTHENEPDTFFFTVSKGQDVACECKLKFHPACPNTVADNKL